MIIEKIEDAFSAEAIIGVNSGYQHKNETDIDLWALSELIKLVLDEVEEKTSIYVSGTIEETRSVYKTSQGCPEGGEKTFRFSADCKPSYSSLPKEEYHQKWISAFMMVIERIMRVLDQTTVTAKIDDNLYYLKRN